METLTQTQSTTELVPTKGKIFFAAFNPRTQLPVICRPIEDRTGRLYTGQGEIGYFENLTEDEKVALAKKGIPVIDNETSVTIEHDGSIDLDNPIDAANWKWLQKHPYISLDKGKKTRDTVFYVVNPQKDAKLYVDRTAKIDQARPAVRALSQSDQVRVASALGLSGAKTFSADQLLEWLLKECNTRPETVLSIINPENSAKVNATIFFKDMLKWRIVERMKDGAFYFGGPDGVNIGITEETCVNYLLSPENLERVKAMKARYAEVTKTQHSVN